MLKKINRQKCLEQYPQFARFEDNAIFEEGENFFYPEVHSSYNLVLNSKNFRTHVHALAFEITYLMKRLGFTSLLFLPNSDTPWLRYLDQDAHCRAASLFFSEHHIQKNFSGALVLNDKMFPVFFKHFFWLMRCNDAYPLVYFTDRRQQIMGCICSYGSLHLDVLNPELDVALQQKLAAGRLEMIGPDSCTAYATGYSPNAPAIRKRRPARHYK